MSYAHCHLPSLGQMSNILLWKSRKACKYRTLWCFIEKMLVLLMFCTVLRHFQDSDWLKYQLISEILLNMHCNKHMKGLINLMSGPWQLVVPLASGQTLRSNASDLYAIRILARKLIILFYHLYRQTLRWYIKIDNNCFHTFPNS